MTADRPADRTYWACPCCGFTTLPDQPGTGMYDLCPVCFWEDDPRQFADPDLREGANGTVSLNEARATFRRLGAMHEEFLDKVRLPLATEIPSDS